MYVPRNARRGEETPSLVTEGVNLLPVKMQFEAEGKSHIEKIPHRMQECLQPTKAVIADSDSPPSEKKKIPAKTSVLLVLEAHKRCNFILKLVVPPPSIISQQQQ